MKHNYKVTRRLLSSERRSMARYVAWLVMYPFYLRWITYIRVIAIGDIL